MTVVGDADGRCLYVDGRLVRSLPGAIPADFFEVQLGFNVSRFHLYEALIYRRALDDTELDQLHDYMQGRYLR